MPTHELILIIAMAVGVLCLAVFYWSNTRDRKKEEPVGLLHIVNDEDDGPYMFLELQKPPEELYSKDTVTFWVDNMPYEAFTKVGASEEEAAEAMQRLANFGLASSAECRNNHSGYYGT